VVHNKLYHAEIIPEQAASKIVKIAKQKFKVTSFFWDMV